jgi:rubredoxin
MKYKCIVCGEMFDDVDEHLEKKGDKEHLDIYRDAEWKKNSPCFCGGTVIWTRQGEDGWSAECNRCGWLWNED